MARKGDDKKALTVEQALRESERRYRLLAENSEDVIFTLDNEFQPTYVSPSIQRLLGVSPEEALGEQLADIMTPGSYAMILQRRLESLEAAARGEPAPHQRLTLEIYRKDDSTVWVETIVKPQFDEQGRKIGFVGVSRDVTMHMRTEAALRESESRYRSLYENTPAMLHSIDNDFRLISVSDVWLDKLGYSREEVLGRRNIDFMTEQSRREALEINLPKYLATGELRDVPYQFVCKDGRILDVLLSSISERDPAGRIVRSLAVVEDVTERKKAEDALRESAAKFRGLFERSPIAMMLFDANTVVLDVNQAMEATFNSKYEQYIGLNLLGKMPDGPLKQSVVQSLACGEANVEGLYNSMSSGKEMYLKARINRVFEDLYMAFLEDVTQAKEMEFSLIAAKELAEDGAKAKSEFLANMSHEIRTPLNAVLGLLQILATTDLSPNQKDYVSTALESGKSLLTLIGDILDLAKIEAGKLEIEYRPFDPAALLGSVVKTFREQAETKGLSLVLTQDAFLPPLILGDEIRLRQVLFNLVGNAVKFTGAGEVRVKAEVAGKPEASGALRLRFHVSDTGVGISAKKLPQVFEPFTQADGSYTRKHQGTGLGLSIVRRLVELMDGQVTLDSQEGVGTTATFEIAAMNAPHAQKHASPQPGHLPLSPGLSVLLVEDDPVNLLTVREILNLAGFATSCATNGELALAALRTRRFDLVLMDIQMPVMDGIEATRRIRAGEAGAANANLPIVAITAHTVKGDKEEFLAAGMNGYIAKPVDLDNLRDVIEECLRQHGQ
jgi:PAS domain S-box-containing protein